MRSLIRDRLFSLVIAAIIAFFSILLYLDFQKRIDYSGKQIGTITYKRRVARRKYNRQVIWEEVEQLEPMYNLDTILTAGMSDARIKLIDGTEIDLDENTMITISLSRKSVSIEFDRGSLSMYRYKKIEGAAKDVVIKAPQSTITTQEGDLRLSKTAKALDCTVTSGTASIIAGNMVKTIGKNQKAILGPDMEKIKVDHISLVLGKPLPGACFSSFSGTRSVEFSWEPVASAKTVTVEISRVPDFSRISHREKVQSPQTFFLLTEGTYYWRLTAQEGADIVRNSKTGIGKDNTGRVYSDTRKLTIIREKPVSLLSPGNGRVYRYTESPPLINFRWRKTEIAQSYTVSISKTPAIKEEILRLEAAGNSVSVDSLGKGVYYWQVRAVSAIAGHVSRAVSRVNKIVIKKLDVMGPLVIIYPQNNSIFTEEYTRKKTINFCWKQKPGIKRYRLEISADETFKTRIGGYETSNNFYYYSGALTEGVYYWRVKGIINYDTIDREVASSKIAVFEVISYRAPLDYAGDSEDEDITSSRIGDILDPPMIVAPENESIINMEHRDYLGLNWKGTPGADSYEIKLFHLTDTNHPVLVRRINGTGYKIFSMKSLSRGKFLMTCQALQTDRQKRVFRKSPIVKRSFSLTLGKILENPEVGKPEIRFDD